MAYDDSTYRRGGDAESTAGGSRYDDSGYSDSGYRAGTDFRAAASGYASDVIAGGDYADPEPVSPPPRRTMSAAALDDVFDDPSHGERGRDRLAVHFLWELVLIVAVVGFAYLLHRDFPDAARRPAVDTLLVYATGLGLLTLGAGLSLRAAAPNLAIGPVAVASALHFAENGDNGVLPAALMAAGAAAALGLVIAVLVLGLHVPGWAGSFAAALAVIVFIQQRTAPVELQGLYDPTRHALYFFAGFVTLALVGAGFGSIKAIRRAVGRLRPVGDPADRRGGMAVALSGSAIIVSMAFASVAGVLLASTSGAPVAPSPGVEWTGLAFGAALVAGTSAFGRRGGILGTVAAVALLTLFIRYSDLRGWNISLFAVAAGAMAIGLVVTRLVETYGRPRPPQDDDERQWINDVPTPTWTTTRRERADSWSSALPAQPTEARADAWDSDRWAGSGR